MLSSGCSVLAHTVLSGAGDFVNGLFHPLSSPPNLLLLGALGLALAQSRPLRLREPLLALLAGLIVGSMSLALYLTPAILSGLTLLIALSVVGGLPMSGLAKSTLAGLAGLALSMDLLGPSPTMSGTAGAIQGLILATTAVAFYASLRPNRPWADIGIRILAAWIAAISILLVAMAVRK